MLVDFSLKSSIISFW